MAATATASSTGVRYAPEDPTLPKPWRGLVDGKTGYLYFWNPETNTTQYERPVDSLYASNVSSQKSLSLTAQKSFQGHHSVKDDDNRNRQGGNGGSTKVASGTETYQTARSSSDYSQNDSGVKTNAGYGSYASKGEECSMSVESYCQRHEITVTGANVPQPFTSFQASCFPSEILREVQNAGFSAPTPIQAQSWPIAVQGRDIVAIAKTGSGKTLGYLIPGFVHLKQRQNNPRLGPTVLVLSPTRELATQIQDEAMKFGRSSKISCTCLYGGAPKGPQLKDLDRGVDIVVATPGRLNDILEMRRISLHQVSYLVLDEADRMLDMGFEPQIRKVVKEVPSRRQTLMYTATWPKEVRRIAADLLVNPVQVNIGNVDELVANKAITQHVEVLSPMDKRRRLEQILRSQEPGSKIIVFCSTKKMCDLLAGNLAHPFGAAAIHGDKSQGERDHVLSQFRSGRSPVLVATDVAARGLDIKDIRLVINYDFPTGIEDYVHRIGRTGRAGAAGVAYTFFCDQDAKHASDLVKLLEGANQLVPVEVRDMASRGGGMGRARRWGSGPSEYDAGRGGGHNDSANSGRDVGRGGWGMSSSSDRGGSSGYGHEQHNRDGFGSSDGHYANATGSFPNKSFHESMMAAGKNSGKSHSRSRSPIKNSGWGENHGRARSRSRSSERFDGVAPTRLSFHESMMAGARSLPSESEQSTPFGNTDTRDHKSCDDPQNHQEKLLSPLNAEQAWDRSSPKQSCIDKSTHVSNPKEEHEEGMTSAEVMITHFDESTHVSNPEEEHEAGMPSAEVMITHFDESTHVSNPKEEHEEGMPSAEVMITQQDNNMFNTAK